MNPSAVIRSQVARIIEDVVSGRIATRADLAVRAAELADDLDVECAAELHQAGHFLDDEDIRRGDSDYGTSQRRRLEQAITRLRSVSSRAAE